MSYATIPVHSADELNAMSNREFRSYEARLRRAVQRQGYSLHRSRRRDPRATDYGTYMIVNPETNTVEAYGLSNGYGLDLEDVARWINDDECR